MRYRADMDFDHDIDARDLRCPLPVLRLQKALRDLPVGTVLRLCATDAMALVDVPHFCAQAGHRFLGQSVLSDGAAAYFVAKGAD